jgi:hypothetical protein
MNTVQQWELRGMRRSLRLRQADKDTVSPLRSPPRRLSHISIQLVHLLCMERRQVKDQFITRNNRLPSCGG